MNVLRLTFKKFRKNFNFHPLELSKTFWQQTMDQNRIDFPHDSGSLKKLNKKNLSILIKKYLPNKTFRQALITRKKTEPCLR